MKDEGEIVVGCEKPGARLVRSKGIRVSDAAVHTFGNLLSAVHLGDLFLDQLISFLAELNDLGPGLDP